MTKEKTKDEDEDEDKCEICGEETDYRLSCSQCGQFICGDCQAWTDETDEIICEECF